MALLSVIVPVYKVEPYLYRCVDSILTQTFSDFELILVDDGSPDNCGAICDEYAAKDARVHVIHQENGGLSAARNAGIDWAFANSNSEWITFVDSDDWIHPRMLEELYRVVNDYGEKISICGYGETEGEGIWNGKEMFDVHIWDTEEYYVQRYVNATIAVGKLYSKKCFWKVRYPVGKIHEDEFITYRLLFEFNRVAVIDAPLYAYYMNSHGITKSQWSRRRLDKLVALRQQIDWFRDNGFERALKKQTYNLAVNLGTQIQGMIETGYAPRKIYMLRKELRAVLWSNRRDAEFRKKDNAYLYEIAYPKVSWFYWTICGIISRFIRK